MLHKLTTSSLVLLVGLLPTSSAWAEGLEGEPVKEIIRDTFSDAPEIAEAVIEIGECESEGLVHRLPNGRYLPNTLGSGAAGALQLTVRTHQKESDRLGLGLDLSTDDGYFTYVRHMVENNGFRDWRWSEDCWGDLVKEILDGNDPRQLLS